jgi:hypothetical protein
MADTNDIFGVDQADISETSSVDYPSVEIRQLTMASPGWRAVYEDDEGMDDVVAFPICAIGVVEITPESGVPYEDVRHFVGLPTGVIQDARQIENFLCVVAPDQRLEDVVAAIKTQRQLM